MEHGCTVLVERVDSLESRLGVGLSAIFAGWEPELGFIIVRGELHSKSGSEITRALSISAAAYDDRGRVIATEERIISEEQFFEFHIFQLTLSVARKPAKIRLFPKQF